MTSELFALHATTCSDATYTLQSSAIVNFSGAMYLASDLWSGFVTNTAGTLATTNSSIRVPKGCAFKIWESSVYGQVPGYVAIEASANSGATYMVIAVDSTGISGEAVTVNRSGRPIVVEAHDSNKLVKFNGHVDANATTGQLWGDYVVEITEI
jgi:hypothetical protein